MDKASERSFSSQDTLNATTSFLSKSISAAAMTILLQGCAVNVYKGEPPTGVKVPPVPSTSLIPPVQNQELMRYNSLVTIADARYHLDAIGGFADGEYVMTSFYPDRAGWGDRLVEQGFTRYVVRMQLTRKSNYSQTIHVHIRFDPHTSQLTVVFRDSVQTISALQSDAIVRQRLPGGGSYTTRQPAVYPFHLGSSRSRLELKVAVRSPQ